ncbi:alpha-ribazole phosphatase [Flammeovirgaceae bacterium SG7u.111]|nr:alpha-ribazole phosphatase [Flammeovirgaceae bacterium SG7u.132]WPO36899.1 alpha-ribazole phosphatase [Flammeovirgaceae bacterium SG7u.111]
MEIYLVRHTTPDVERGILYGQTDLGLSEIGKKEVGEVCSKLPEELMNADLYSSPLARCKILAENIEAKLGIKNGITYDDRLKELSFGDWEMRKWAEIKSEESKSWVDDFVDKSAPNGESFQVLSERVMAAFNSIAANPENSNPKIIVAHAGVIRCIIANLLGVKLKNVFQLYMKYGSISKVEVGKDFKRLMFFNF